MLALWYPEWQDATCRSLVDHLAETLSISLVDMTGAGGTQWHGRRRGRADDGGSARGQSGRRERVPRVIRLFRGPADALARATRASLSSAQMLTAGSSLAAECTAAVCTV